MAYRRKHGTTRATLQGDACYHPSVNDDRDNSKGSPLDSNSMRSPHDQSKYGFWGVLARKAKAIIEDENDPQQLRPPLTATQQMNVLLSNNQTYPQQSIGSVGQEVDNVKPQRPNALEEGGVKSGRAFQESHKLQIKTKGIDTDGPWLPIQPTQTQLKASRDVAMATAAKAKLLLRELKTVKAELAFAKQRCSQLEEENKRLREGTRDKGASPADDDLIRLQIETLLAEKARLAHENSVYARENRFLREIVEYHHLTMHDLVDLEEASGEEEEDGEEQVSEYNEDGQNICYAEISHSTEIYNTPKFVKQLISSSNPSSSSHLSTSSSTDQSKADYPNRQEG